MHTRCAVLTGVQTCALPIYQTAIVPRVAASWTIIPGVTFRGAWSQGFRAPILVQVNDAGTTRSNARDDFVICQAQVEQGIIDDLGVCPGEGVIKNGRASRRERVCQ